MSLTSAAESYQILIIIIQSVPTNFQACGRKLQSHIITHLADKSYKLYPLTFKPAVENFSPISSRTQHINLMKILSWKLTHEWILMQKYRRRGRRPEAEFNLFWRVLTSRSQLNITSLSILHINRTLLAKIYSDRQRKEHSTFGCFLHHKTTCAETPHYRQNQYTCIK